jgi:predicted RNase H-like nuclease (RuvC/YqgF family)
MNLSDLQQVSRKPRRAKSLLERARKYIGAVKGPLKPGNTAAQAKALVRGIATAKHTR